MGHQAVREATDSFLNDRPLQELCARGEATAAQGTDDPQAATQHESEEEGEGEGEGEHNLGDGDDEIVEDDN